MKKTLKVAAAIIENENNEVLCALRSPNMLIPNCWEFPGGKVENNESLFDAIEREIKEELQCIVQAQSVFHENIHEYDNFIINLICIKCKLIDKKPQATEHSKLIWMNKQNLTSLKWAPADIPAVNKLIRE